MRTKIKILMAVPMVLLLLIPAVLAATGTIPPAGSAIPPGGPKNTAPILPKELQDKIDAQKNPVPLDKIKVPVSGIFKYDLENRDLLKGAQTKQSIPQALQPIVFNDDPVGNLPKNEQTVTTFTLSSGNVLVVGGANDYRGFFGLLSGVSGYYVSNNNGASALREGGLPGLSGVTDDNGASFNAISAGDPALDTDKTDGTAYYSSLYSDPTTGTNAIGLGQASPANLQNTALGDSAVWATTKVRADSGSSPQFNDKPWTVVDNSGFTTNIYVSWTAFNAASGTAKIWLASCTPSPFACTVIHNDANPVSDVQTSTQFSQVSVDDQGRVIVTWAEYAGGNPNPPYYTKNVWYRVFAPGGVAPLTGPVLVTQEFKPVDGFFALDGETFRVFGIPWSAPANVGGTPRLFVAYTDCGGNYLFDIPGIFAETCSNSDTYLRYIDNYQVGGAPSGSIALEALPARHSLFPTFSVNKNKNTLDIGWYQTEVSARHDYFLAQQQRSLSSPSTVTQATSLLFASEPTDDAFLFGEFIGDYFQVRTEPGATNRVFAHYTANPIFVNPSLVDSAGFKIGGNAEENLLLVKTY